VRRPGCEKETPPATGVKAQQQGDGSIAFFRQSGTGGPLFTMPRPFMTDARDDASSPYGKAFSDIQAVTQRGANIDITVRAEAGWLKSADRVYPVVIDSGAPATNYGGITGLYVGPAAAAKRGSLLKFDLSSVPAGTKIDAIQLKLYFDQSFETNANTVQLEAQQATSAWTESTVNWNSPVNTTPRQPGLQDVLHRRQLHRQYVDGRSLARRLGGG
jgi:hypothetical protein